MKEDGSWLDCFCFCKLGYGIWKSSVRNCVCGECGLKDNVDDDDDDGEDGEDGDGEGDELVQARKLACTYQPWCRVSHTDIFSGGTLRQLEDVVP